MGGIPAAASVAGFLINRTRDGLRLAGQLPGLVKQIPGALVSNPKRVLNPLSARGGLLYGAGIQKFGPRLGLDQEVVDGLDILAGGVNPLNLVFLLQGGDNPQDPDRKARRLGYASAADQQQQLEEMQRQQAFIGPPSPDFVGPRVPDYQQASYNARNQAPVSDTNEKPTVEMGRIDPFAPITSEEKSIQPSQQPPSAPESSTNESAVEEVKRMLLKDGATNYQDFSKEEINAEYDRLRATDPEEALRFGKDVNSVLFGYY